jgi:hypothetical protein
MYVGKGLDVQPKLTWTCLVQKRTLKMLEIDPLNPNISRTFNKVEHPETETFLKLEEQIEQNPRRYYKRVIEKW